MLIRFLTMICLLLAPSRVFANDAASYEERKQTITLRQDTLAKVWKSGDRTRVDLQSLEKELIGELNTLAEYWLGSDWGRGIPQSSTPQTGKTNCGTFVGTLLRDIGFRVDVKKLQRQASQGIIRSFVRGKRVRKFNGRSMKSFLEGVAEMGPGLYIIGLDMHVGLLIQTETELVYLHSSSETGKVARELAKDAWTIQSSGYRVVGKILSPKNLRYWLAARRIVVQGNS
jgi:hypothetical protein